MGKIYFTLTGTRYYHGDEFLKPGMKLKLRKEPDNKFDAYAVAIYHGDFPDFINASPIFV